MGLGTNLHSRVASACTCHRHAAALDFVLLCDCRIASLYLGIERAMLKDSQYQHKGKSKKSRKCIRAIPTGARRARVWMRARVYAV